LFASQKASLKGELRQRYKDIRKHKMIVDKVTKQPKVSVISSDERTGFTNKSASTALLNGIPVPSCITFEDVEFLTRKGQDLSQLPPDVQSIVEVFKHS